MLAHLCLCYGNIYSLGGGCTQQLGLSVDPDGGVFGPTARPLDSWHWLKTVSLGPPLRTHERRAVARFGDLGHEVKGVRESARVNKRNQGVLALRGPGGQKLALEASS